MSRKTKRIALPISIVKWEDAHADTEGGWVSVDDINPEALVVTSVGIQLPPATKPGHVSLAQSFAEDICDHVIHIPEKMVLEIVVLEAHYRHDPED